MTVIVKQNSSSAEKKRKEKRFALMSVSIIELRTSKLHLTFGGG